MKLTLCILCMQVSLFTHAVESQQLQAPIVNVEKPAFIKFGRSVNEIKEHLKEKCKFIEIHKIEPKTAPFAKNSQTQINCEGFSYAGKSRNVELVFQDNQLDLMWILFPSEDKKSIVQSFQHTYGSPTQVIDWGILYLGINAAIRNQPSEVLFASKRQVNAMMLMLQKEQRAKK